jgi:hypothetical protein
MIDAAAGQARPEIADCDARLRQHREALEADADPKIIAGWMAETQARRAAAESRMRPARSAMRVDVTARPLSDMYVRQGPRAIDPLPHIAL